MTAIDTKAKRGKCLALVAMLAMVVCALAIALPAGESDAADSTTMPSTGTVTTQTVNLENNVTGGVFNYTAIAVNPAVLTINYNAKTSGLSVFENVTMTIGQNVKVIVNLNAASAQNNLHIFSKCKITLNGGELILNQAANADGQTWWGQGATNDTLTMNNESKMTINGMGLSGVQATISGNSTFEVATINSSIAAVNFAEGLEIGAGATVKVSDEKAFVYFAGETEKKIDGTLDAGSSEIRLVSGNITGSGKVIASELTVTDKNSTIGANISGVQTFKATTAGAITNILRTQDQVTVTENIVLSDDLTVPENKTLVLEGCTITSSNNSKIIVEGSLVSDGAYIYVGVEVDEDTGDFTARNTHKLTSTGTLNSNTYVGFGDELTLSGIVPAGINVYAFGKLIIEDLTVNGEVDAYIGSDVQINGKVTVANKFKMNDAALNLTGTIEIKNDKNGGASFELAGASELTVAKDGSFRVLKGTANTAAANTLVIDNEAEFIVEGTLDVTGTLRGTVQDKGTINFNGTSDEATVVLYDGIEFSPVSVTGTLVVCVKGIVADIDKNANDNVADGSVIALANVKGAKIVSSVDVKYNKEKTEKYYFCNLTVSGTLTVAAKGVTESGIGVAADAKYLTIDDSEKYATITVKDAIALGKGTVFANIGVLTVDGTITAVNEETGIYNMGTITVNGLITTKSEKSELVNEEGGKVNAVVYTITDAEGAVSTYYSGFAGAIENIADADEKTVTVQNSVTASKDAEVPADATIAVEGTLTIKDGATITVADGAVMNVTGTVTVNGTLVIANTDTGLTLGTIKYQVYTENGKTATYTSLANALKNAKEGDVITLSGDVKFSSDAEIPAGVTVNVGKNKMTIGKGVTLIVNGTLNFAKNSTLVITDAKDIVANGVVSYYTGDVATALNSLKIEGAYFTLKGVNYITNVAYAAENCNEGTITIKYSVTAGDVTFKAGKNGLTITTEMTPGTNQLFRAGTITLDGATLVVEGKMTGTVTAKADGSTATIALTNADGITISSEAVDDADFMYITSNADTTGDAPVYSNIGGKVEIKAGTVTSKATMNTTNVKTDSIIVASGATLVIAKDTTLNVADNGSTRLVVDGTLQVIGALAINGKAVVNGTMTVQNANVTVTGELSILGTLEMKDKTSSDVADGKITVNGVLSVGTKTTSLGASATVIGAVDAAAGCVKAYPGSDMTKAKINWNTDMDASDAKSLDFIVNGAKYMTVYTNSSSLIIFEILGTEDFEIIGVVNDGLKTVTNWYTSEEMKDGQKVNESATVSGLASVDVSAIYASAAASEVQGTITQGTGLELFIDGKNYTQFADGKLTVGTHTVMMNVKAGYDGSNASVTFNGVAVTDGKITITADMTSFTLVASGATPASSQVVVDGGDKNDGMGLTDILLLVLVVLIAVMAIMVALRLMRS